MENVKIIDTLLMLYAKEDVSGGLSVPINVILNFLKEYEVGVPEDYFNKFGPYFGAYNFLVDKMQMGTASVLCQNNTYDMAGYVSVDFGFLQVDSLVSDESWVLIHIHNADPFLRESICHNKYPSVLIRLPKGISFYNVLDNIVFESSDVPSMNIELEGMHYLVLPLITSESYFVKCLETGEEIEPCDDVICGDEKNVKTQLSKLLGMPR